MRTPCLEGEGRKLSGKKKKRKKDPTDNRRATFSFLDEEKIEEIANKEWKKPTIFTNDERFAKKIKNLTGPKTVEGKKKALQNLRPAPSLEEGSRIAMKHGGYVHALLTKDEIEFYEERKSKYLKDFELNDSSDEALLRAVLMEEVIWYRLMKKRVEKPTLDLDRPINDCMKRLRESLKALGMTREQRQGFNVNIRASIADLVDRVEREFYLDEEKMRELDEEELRMIEEKRERERNMTIDADFTILDQEFEKVEEIEKEKFSPEEDEDED